MLIAEGAHPRAIMERLGHSTVQVTLGTYGHVFPTLEASLTAALDDVYRTAEPTPSAEVRKIEG
jgi:integrase